jgi:hypothetical protein
MVAATELASGEDMLSTTIRTFALTSAVLLLTACGQKLDLELRASLDGKPVEQARVKVDGEDIGATDAQGVFAKTLRKKAGAEVDVQVSKEQPGFRIEPWKTTFLVKLPKEGQIDKYAFDASLKAMRYVTLVASERGTPLGEAVVKAGGKEIGKTDARGEYIYEYKELPKGGVDLAVTKPGYSVWRKTGAVEPGQRIEVALARRAIVNISAVAEEYGRANGIPDVSVSVGGKVVGRTDARGRFTYSYDGEPGKTVQVTLSAPGHIPNEWKTSVTLEGEVNLQRYFYPTTPKAIRTGIYRFVGNTPGVDLKDEAQQAESALAAQLFRLAPFREVPSKTLQAEVKRLKLNIDKIITRGWNDTGLRATADMIVLGSVAKDDKGYLVEAKFYTSGGKLILSQISRARSAGDINSAAREIAGNVIERFPFEGTVIGVDEQRYRVNIGKPYRISRGTELALTAPTAGADGKVTGYRETGRLVAKKSEDNGAWTEVESLRKGEKVSLGDRVVRRVYHEGEKEAERKYFVLTAKGGIAPDVAPLAGVNIYLNNDWVGSTGPDGKAEVPLRLGKGYTLVLYRHGYQQFTDKLRVDKNQEAREFLLAVNNSIFKVDSEPSRASVSVDGESFGKTPLTDGKPVPLGFHTVKLSVGEDYRDWEEVVEFDKKVEDRTGERRIVLHKDFLRIGEKAQQAGNLDAAIQAYASTQKGHPDYSEAHHRLAQIYLDDKDDYEGAIREFESVLALPENQQLIYKQYAVAFTNLGHAYYEKGNGLAQKDREAAAQNLTKAVQQLQVAKQNTRFFPTQDYDEALHDTYYYLALSYHKLYLLSRKSSLQDSANNAWREYFDFFPKKLEGKGEFEQSREAARKYWDQIREP